MNKYIKSLTLLTIIFALDFNASVLTEPTSESKDLYPQDILTGNYDDQIDKPSKFLDFNYGDRVASPSQISNAIKAWSKQSNKLKVTEYARSHEDRPLYALVISSPDNISQLNTVQANMPQLISSVNFNDGFAYGDFNPDIDEIAAYGIGGLIAGKVLMKAGFIGLILKFWKIIALAVAGGFGLFKNKLAGLFSKRNSED